MSLISLQKVSKYFILNKGIHHLLQEINLEIKQGESVSIIGPSGSGKSSLLKIIGLLDVPNSGSIFIHGMDCTAISENQQTNLRREYIGFIFQSYNLLHDFTALENIVLPQSILGVNHDIATNNAIRLLKELKLEKKTNYYPNQLSGGEQQRIAIARSLINKPKIILADEPTGNLDFENTQNISRILSTLSRKYQVSLIIITHDIDLATKADKMYSLRNGRLQDITRTLYNKSLIKYTK